MNLATKLTLSRIALSPLICGCIVWNTSASLWVALLLFLIAGATDYLDGYVATHTKTRSSVGALLDPLADKTLVILVFFSLAAIGRLTMVNYIPVFCILFREFALIGLRDFMGQKAQALPVMSLAKWKTACQFMSLVWFLCPQNLWMVLLSSGFVWVSAGLSLWTGWLYSQKAWTLLKNS